MTKKLNLKVRVVGLNKTFVKILDQDDPQYEFDGVNLNLNFESQEVLIHILDTQTAVKVQGVPVFEFAALKFGDPFEVQGNQYVIMREKELYIREHISEDLSELQKDVFIKTEELAALQPEESLKSKRRRKFLNIGLFSFSLLMLMGVAQAKRERDIVAALPQEIVINDAAVYSASRENLEVKSRTPTLKSEITQPQSKKDQIAVVPSKNIAAVERKSRYSTQQENAWGERIAECVLEQDFDPSGAKFCLQALAKTLPKDSLANRRIAREISRIK